MLAVESWTWCDT